MEALDQYIKDSNLAVIRSYPRLKLVQLQNLKLVEIHVVDDDCYSIQEVTRSLPGESSWDISLENIDHQIKYLES
jgi:hypothetical protein